MYKSIYCAMMAMALAVVACGSSKDQPQPSAPEAAEIQLEKSTVTVPSSAGTTTLAVNTNRTVWTVSTDASWLKPGKTSDGSQLATVQDGILTITLAKIDDKVYSIRMNSKKAWTYGWFEACLKLPTGKGTWPAFWMMPKNYKTWPGDGEIDIMEEVGYNPNYVSSSIHCNAYNHVQGTQRTTERLIEGAQDDFHVYALEWTPDVIRTYVDGYLLFQFANDGQGNYDTWPFFNPFYLKLNLAWGGNWGAAMGIDESCLPARYLVDYVRVFQKDID